MRAWRARGGRLAGDPCHGGAAARRPDPSCRAVGPFASPSETYQYYEALPFCQPAEKDNKLLTLGEVRSSPISGGIAPGPMALPAPHWLRPLPCAQVVDANRMVATEYDLSFRVDREKTVLCSKKFGDDELKKFRKVGVVPPTPIALLCCRGGVADTRYCTRGQASACPHTRAEPAGARRRGQAQERAGKKTGSSPVRSPPPRAPARCRPS